MEYQKMRVRLTFTESILGTSPSDPEIYTRFIGSKSPDANTIDEEVEALGADEVAGRSLTCFPRTEDGVPFIYDYQIKGYFKDTCGALKKVPGHESASIKAYKKEIDRLIFPQPRKIIFHDYGEVGECQRPLRAQTMQGERVALAYSEEIHAGAWIEFDILMLNPHSKALVKEWLDYGVLSGIGQWHNSGKGRFTWQEV